MQASATSWNCRVIKLHAKTYAKRPEVLADVIGELAVHPTLLRPGAGGVPFFSEIGFTVTHIPTGLALHTSLRREAAIALAKELCGLDWSFKTVNTIPRATNDVAKAALRQRGWFS